MNKYQFTEMLLDLDPNELAEVYFNLPVPKEYAQIMRIETERRMHTENIMVVMEFKKHIENLTYIKEITSDRLVELIKELQAKVKDKFLSLDWRDEFLLNQIDYDEVLPFQVDHTRYSLVKYMAVKYMEKGAELIA
ncbi:hypothetical protein F400_gp009 [Bacillus phage BCD7]|uniref:Uncharacterized protein n=1 Tax=Bacillus phage BCD7 TaxID=1136534 RepID=J9PUK5_9CAUD|nr:hypothetical protein F400_gp009 [Bacillus phage BCD7]AEZ50456.1 hypothetical protein BCD7_0009 [Bacillus phage BCD7]